jgi:hypothetical protein
VVLPEIQRLINESDDGGAFRLARRTMEVLPNDAVLHQLWLNATVIGSIRTEPSGADVEVKGLHHAGASWYSLGRSPLENVRIPFGPVRLRLSARGFDPVEVSGGGAIFFARGVHYRLDRTGTVPPGMVRVRGGLTRFANIEARLGDYWIDRIEVTNDHFKAFVDAGGYRRREYWREPFMLDDGRRLSWEEAMGRFRDATGQPGPATWESGTYPGGASELPVSGVSWYEAAAYAVFAGKSLPTAFHWNHAAGFSAVVDLIGSSNFAGDRPAPHGRYDSLGPSGTFDMAGNVKEWASNQVGNQRLTLGGAWNEPGYMFWNTDAHAPFDRQPNQGFRCVKYMEPVATAVSAPIPHHYVAPHDLAGEEPVEDQIFKVYQGLYRYDPRPLNASVDVVEETPAWRKETITLDAGYGRERVRAYVFLPKHVSPPFQVVLGFPPGEAFAQPSSRELGLRWVDFVVRGGRALLYPIYKGTFERGPSSLDVGPHAARDEVIAWSKDASRSIDYLETRADMDRSRIAFYGVSIGADAGFLITALEPRIKVSALLGGGPVNGAVQLSEAHFVNFVPRVRIPTLLLYGRNDVNNPLATFQIPLFRHALVVDNGDAAQVQTIFAGDRTNLFVVANQSDSRDALAGRLCRGYNCARIVSFRKNDVLWP